MELASQVILIVKGANLEASHH